LRKAGYRACLVGGGVRDLLLGLEPKDFDIATDAHPEQVRALFRNCRLIGRRFRLAHVHFGPEIIEVATFRALHDPENDDAAADSVLFNDSGRIMRDNVYGSIEDDALRRDFTVNALYYDIDDFSVIDYVGGLEDLKAGVIRLIGDPDTRFREDPVRMLRAVRFATKLGLRLHFETEASLRELRSQLRDVPAARLFDEVLKLFLAGHGTQTFEGLRHYGLFEELFPLTDETLSREEHGFPHTFLVRALENTDRRISESKPVTPAFLIAALLWEPVRERWQQFVDAGEPELMAMQLASDDVLRLQAERTSLPRRFTTVAREIWAMQLRLPRRAGRRAQRLVEHPRFRAGYDFLLLRGESGEEVAELCDWWTRFQETDEAGRAKLVSGGPGGGTRSRRGGRRRSRRPKGAGTTPG
jgi:poly(A) polymerase